MPAIFINPNTEEHINLLNRLKEQNQDLRVFISDKIEKEFIEKLPGKKVDKLYRIANGCHVFSGLKQKKHTCWVKSIKMYTNKKASHFCEAFHNL